jgi:hypothetical protein
VVKNVGRRTYRHGGDLAAELGELVLGFPPRRCPPSPVRSSGQGTRPSSFPIRFDGDSDDGYALRFAYESAEPAMPATATSKSYDAMTGRILPQEPRHVIDRLRVPELTRRATCPATE